MDEVSFKPDYGIRGLLEKGLAFIVMPIYLIADIVLLVKYKELSLLLSGQGWSSTLYEFGIPILFMLFICHQRPKEIILSRSQIIIKKHIFPEQRAGLNELTAIGDQEFKIGKIKINLTLMKNGKDLSAMIMKVIDGDMPQRGQEVENLPAGKSRQEQILSYAGAVTILFLMVWYGIWYLFINDFKYFVNPVFVGGIGYVIAYFGISLFLKNKHK